MSAPRRLVQGPPTTRGENASNGSMARILEAALLAWWRGDGQYQGRSDAAHCRAAGEHLAVLLADAGITDQLLAQRHEVEFGEDGWAMQHPIGCRPDLLACDMDDWLRELDLDGPPPAGFGRYTVVKLDDTLLVQPLED